MQLSLETMTDSQLLPESAPRRFSDSASALSQQQHQQRQQHQIAAASEQQRLYAESAAATSAASLPTARHQPQLITDLQSCLMSHGLSETSTNTRNQSISQEDESQQSPVQQSAVIQQLLLFVERHCAQLLDSALVYAAHAGRTHLSIEDLELAVAQLQLSQFRQASSGIGSATAAGLSNAAAANIQSAGGGLNVSSTGLVTDREALAQLASLRNAVPLPIVPQRRGILLPPTRFTQQKENFDLHCAD